MPVHISVLSSASGDQDIIDILREPIHVFVPLEWLVVQISWQSVFIII
jgi:hypothetical protein